jgi:hypothetical protein
MMRLVRGGQQRFLYKKRQGPIKLFEESKNYTSKEPRKGHRGFKKSDDGQMSDESRTDQRQNVLRGWNPKGLAH